MRMAEQAEREGRRHRVTRGSVSGSGSSSGSYYFASQNFDAGETLRRSNSYSGPDGDLEEAAPFHFNFHFSPCFSPEGLDFGFKFASRLYEAQKHVRPERQMISYTHCRSNTETFSHVVTLNISRHRIKQALFLFNSSIFDKGLGSAWPDSIRLKDIKAMIQDLGPAYEFCKTKASGAQFSIYLFLIKDVGTEVSIRTRNNYHQWAQSCARETPPRSSKQIFKRLAKLGGSIVSAVFL